MLKFSIAYLIHSFVGFLVTFNKPMAANNDPVALINDKSAEWPDVITATVGQEWSDFLMQRGIVSRDKFAFIAIDVTGLEGIFALQDAPVTTILSAERATLRILYTACKALFSAEIKVQTTLLSEGLTSGLDEPITGHDLSLLVREFSRKNNVTIASTDMPSDSIMGRILREVRAKTFSVFDLTKVKSPIASQLDPANK